MFIVFFYQNPAIQVKFYLKLGATEDLDARREIRKQIRAIRNRKFEEELSKISAGQTKQDEG